MTLQELLGENYKEDLSMEELKSLLADIDMPKDMSGEINTLKNALNKSSSEAANYKRQLRDKLTEEEAKAAQVKEEQDRLKQQYEELLLKTTIAEHKAKLMGLGYEEDLALKTAKALCDGESEEIFNCYQKHLKQVEKKIRAEVFQTTPKPIADSSSERVMKLDDFKKLSVEERLRFSEEHPEEYAELYGGKN